LTAPQNILFIRLSSIGDIILTTPVVRCVREKFPEATISFVIKKEYYSLIQHNPHIQHIYTYEKKKGEKNWRKLCKELKNKKFDWIVDLHRNLRSLYLKQILGRVFTTTYNKLIYARTMLVLFGVDLYKSPKLVMLRYFEAVEKLHISYDNLGTEIIYNQQDEDFTRDVMTREGIDLTKEIITICPSASFTNKRWLPERFAAVGDLLIENYQCQIVFLGGKSDYELCNQIRTMMKNQSYNLAGKLPLLSSAKLLKISKLVLSNDSGMMHLAQSQKRPVVAIFGSTVKQLGYFPIPNNSEIAEVHLPCRPCTHIGQNKCPKKHFKCMKEVSIELVLSKIKKLLAIC